MTTETTPDKSRTGLVVPWGWLSLILAIVAIASLGTVAVIAKKQNADSLSTIALALAILSFSAQLIVTLAQAYNGTLQIAQAGQVNADTRSSLAEIRATSNALLSNQREQFTEVLRAALNTAVSAAVEDVAPSSDAESYEDSEQIESSSRDLEERLFVRLNEALAKSGSAPAVFNPPAARTPSPIYQQIRTYPNEERGREALEALNEMSPAMAATFSRNATLIRDRARNGQPPNVTVTPQGPNVDPESLTGRLERLGVFRITEIPSGTGNRRFSIELTDLGIRVASLFLGAPPRPDWMNDI